MRDVAIVMSAANAVHLPPQFMTNLQQMGNEWINTNTVAAWVPVPPTVPAPQAVQAAMVEAREDNVHVAVAHDHQPPRHHQQVLQVACPQELLVSTGRQQQHGTVSDQQQSTPTHLQPAFSQQQHHSTGQQLLAAEPAPQQTNPAQSMQIQQLAPTTAMVQQRVQYTSPPHILEHPRLRVGTSATVRVNSLPALQAIAATGRQRALTRISMPTLKSDITIMEVR
jgi:hypothetical protein